MYIHVHVHVYVHVWHTCPTILCMWCALSNTSFILCIVCIEVTQEVASRGMGLTYDLCDGSTKEAMVQSLVSTLMEGRR